MASLYNIAAVLNLERLYNTTSDLGIDYEKGCQIFTDFDKCTFYNVHVNKWWSGAVVSRCMFKYE